MRTALQWLGAIAASVLCIGILNLLWLQGIIGLMEMRPLSPENSGAVARYLNTLFLGFDGIILYILLMHFRSVKKNFADLFWMCVIMIAGLFILTSVIMTTTPALGFWIPSFEPLYLFAP